MEQLGIILFIIGLLQPAATIPLIVRYTDLWLPVRICLALFISAMLMYLLLTMGVQITFSYGTLCV